MRIMSSFLTSTTQATKVAPHVSVKFYADELISAEEFASIISASVDLLRVAGLAMGLRQVARGSSIYVRRAHYGSPIEIVFGIMAAGSGAVTALAMTATRILNSVGEFKVKLATADKISAEAGEIRVKTARQQIANHADAQEFLRQEGEAVEATGEQYDPAERVYKLRTSDNKVLEIDKSTLEDFILAQADELITSEVREIGGAVDVPEINDRAIRSLIVVSQLRGEVRLTDE
jgi:hypothetical protein